MAHYAELDNFNTVTRVIVIPNDQEATEDQGIAYCQSLFGSNTHWRKTSYTASIRKNFAGKGFQFDSIRNAFIPPKPFASWVFNEDTCRWDPPTPMPTDGFYRWDELIQNWKELT